MSQEGVARASTGLAGNETKFAKAKADPNTYLSRFNLDPEELTEFKNCLTTSQNLPILFICLIEKFPYLSARR